MKSVPKLEFSRPFEARRVSPRGSFEKFSADPQECAALAKRFAIPSVKSIKADLVVAPWRGGGLKVTGEVVCHVEQISVVSLETFASEHRFDVERFFLPGHATKDDDDTDAIEGGLIDLGEIVSETIALELDPYPRKPGEAFSDMVEDDAPTDTVRPFAKLIKKD